MVANIKRLVYFGAWADPVAEEIIRKQPDIELLRLDLKTPQADNWTTLQRTHGYQVGSRVDLREPWFPDGKLFEKAPELLACCSMGAGYDAIDVEDCTKAGIIVCNQTGANREGVAEHAMALMLSLSKKVMVADRMIRRQADVERNLYKGNDVLGRTIGIVGIGNIGGRMAELCNGLFRMTVLAYDPYQTEAQIAAKGAKKVELDELLRQSDYVSVHCPRTDETFGMIGAAEFAKMKPTAYFINTARGGIHKEDDLAEALTKGTIMGAGLDVFLKEPPDPSHPLLQFDNVIANPHIAGVTYESRRELASWAAAQWLDIFAGRAPPRLINPEVWPLYCDRFEKILGFRPAELPKDYVKPF